MIKKLRPIKQTEQYTMITVGIILMVAGFYYFLLPADLVAGGVTGLGLILNKYFTLPISLFVGIINVLLLLLGLILLGKKLFLRSIYGSILFPTILFVFERFLPHFDLQNDYVITSIFGGALLGLGFGLVIKYGGTSGGTDIPIKILNKKFKIPVSFSIYMIDGTIVLLGVIAFYQEHGIITGLYAILTLFISGRVADMVIVGGNSKKAMQIITDYPNQIKDAIFQSIERGVTVVDIEGGYTAHKKTMLITVITKQEYYLIRNIIARIDATAFVYVTPATEIHGDFYERESDE